MRNSPDRLEETQLELVPSFDTDAEIRKDEKTLMTPINVLQMIKTRNTATSRIPRSPIRKQMKVLIRVAVGQHGVHEIVRIVEVPRFVFPALAVLRRDCHTASEHGGRGCA